MDNSGAYRVMYTLTVSGTYDASVVLGATGIANRYRNAEQSVIVMVT
jgi:hypothetical protein